jgi:predicted nucleic acid-binding protein
MPAKPLIYLDACCLGRLTDTPDQIRIELEQQANIAIIEQIRDHQVRLCSSAILEFEISCSKIKERRELALEVLKMANLYVAPSRSIDNLAKQLQLAGIKGKDSLHLASAIDAECDMLLTVDDRFLRSAARLQLSVHMADPVQALRGIIMIKNQRKRTIFQIHHDAVLTLVDHMGLPDTLRFLHALGWGLGNYTKERDRLFKDYTLDYFIQGARRINRAKVREYRRRGTKIHGEQLRSKPAATRDLKEKRKNKSRPSFVSRAGRIKRAVGSSEL